MEALAELFNPEYQMFLITKEDPQITKKLTSRAEFERKLFDEVCTNLTKDLEDNGIQVNYSIKLLLHEIALNLVLIGRIKFHLVNRPPSVETHNWKLNSVKGNRYEEKKLMQFESYPTNKETVPEVYQYLLKLEKETTKLLEKLGLLPQQQIERQKLVIIQRMKQTLAKYSDKDKECSIDLITETKKERM